jgi:hypothetical protein
MKKLGAVWKEVKVVLEKHLYKYWHTLEGREKTIKGYLVHH